MRLLKYILRGIGLVLLLGMITSLALTVASQNQRATAHAAASGARR